MAELFSNVRRKKTSLLATTPAINVILIVFVVIIVLLVLNQMSPPAEQFPDGKLISIGGDAADMLRRPLAAMATGN